MRLAATPATLALIARINTSWEFRERERDSSARCIFQAEPIGIVVGTREKLDGQFDL